MRKGFSLVELLVCLIVIGCLLAAFIPLITRKFSSNVYGFGGDAGITTDCEEKFTPNCNLCTNEYCIRCNNLTCPEGQYKDTKSCSCKKCAESYGEDCPKCNANRCLICSDDEYLNSSEVCVPCSNKFSNCTSCNETQCTACEDGYVLDKSNSIVPCQKFECGGDDFIQIGNLCITKKNMGDGDSLTIPEGVNVVQINQSCSPSASNYCCWQGNTSGSGCDNENGGGYSGCNRTVCDWYAADYICKKFKAGGYTWRLATISEMSNWGSNSVGKGASGLQFCGYYSGYSSAYCYDSGRCPGSYDGDCYPYSVWSGDVSNSFGADAYDLWDGWVQISSYRPFAFSVRCVAQMPQSCAQKISKGCLSCDGSSCLSCDSGYILKDGVCKVDCASKFGSSCSECNLAQCTKCADGYKLSSNPSGINACEPPLFMQIGNLLITKYNMGDHTELPVNVSNVIVVPVGTRCSSGSRTYCCWQGNTSGTSCDSINGGYSGCNRTVCDWNAADIICKNLKLGNYTWRLAAEDEMSSWGANSIDKGINGLQLCDIGSGYSSAQCGVSLTTKCYGAFESLCNPSRVWGSSFSINYYLYNGSWSSSAVTYLYTSAFSVRCVADL